MENVKALTQKKFMPTFRNWQDYLSNLGYNNFVQVLNAKDFGVPQNRERVFMVSILGDEWYNFPKPMKLTKCLGDVLESEVDEKYYLSQKLVAGFLQHKKNSEDKGRGFKFSARNPKGLASCISTMAGSRQTDNFIIQRGRGFNDGGIKTECPTITSNSWQENNVVVQLGNLIEGAKFDNPHRGLIYSPLGLSPTLNTCGGGGLEPKILAYTRDSKGKVSNYHEKDLANTIHTSTGSGGNTDQFVMGAIRGRGINNEQRLEINNKGVSNTLTTVQKDNVLVLNNAYIRKLTERECGRLMGVSEEDLNKMLSCGISKTQMYKCFGNSIVVDVLVEIFRELFIPTETNRTLFG